MPCECLFSASGEIATDQHSCLGSDCFGQLQILKHGWHNIIVDHAIINLSQFKNHCIQDFEELYQIQVDNEFTALGNGLEIA